MRIWRIILRLLGLGKAKEPPPTEGARPARPEPLHVGQLGPATSTEYVAAYHAAQVIGLVCPVCKFALGNYKEAAQDLVATLTK